MLRSAWWPGLRPRACRFQKARAVSSRADLVSPAWRWLGIGLVDIGEGSAVVEMTTSEDMANHAGFVHGGMITALADSAMGRSLRTLKPGIARAMSFDLKLTFISAA